MDGTVGIDEVLEAGSGLAIDACIIFWLRDSY